MPIFRRSAAFGVALLGLLCGACGGGSADKASGDAGVLREDAVVLSVGGADSMNFLDAVRDGDTIYLLVNFDYNPVLFVSEDAGDTWTTHKLPPSYDKVEGIEDLSPGLYVLYPWQGHLYMLVAATSATHGVPFWSIAEVDLTTDDYALRNQVFVGKVRFDQGVGFDVSSEGNSFTDLSLEYGNVDWRRYDFVADALTGSGSIPLAGSGLSPRGWASLDGREALALTDTAPANAPAQLCRVSLDTTTGNGSLSSTCMSRLRAPLGSTENAKALTTSTDIGWVTELGGHTFLTRLKPEGETLTATPIDLGPGAPESTNFDSNRRRYGDFLVLPTKGADAMTIQPRPRLIHVSDDDEVQDVDMPWTPCEGGTICGYGRMGTYGTVRWIVPMDDGNVLVFHVVGKTSDGTPQILLMTREHPTLRPASFEPLELGILPSRPELKPAPPAVQQCMRAVTCGYHANLAACEDYWSTVRRSADGTDQAFAAFLAAPMGACSVFEDVYTDRRDPARFKLSPCAAGCDGDWATLACEQPIRDPVRENCAAHGVPCRVDAQGRGICADRELTPANCNTCDGNVAINCTDSPMPMMTDCSLSGQQCHVFVEAPNPSRAICSPGACPPDKPFFCAGGVQTACWPGDPTISGEYDCTRMTEGSTCGDVSTCVTYSVGQICEDDLMVYGVLATSRYIDCKALGFSGCMSTPGRDDSHCVP
jgi:hypothetical protein